MLVYKDIDGKIHECEIKKHRNRIFRYRLDITEIIEIKGFEDLDSITISNCKMSDIDKNKNFDSFTNLKHLDLSKNKITEITGLDTLINLTKLILRSNKITEIKNLDKLVNLKYLNLIDNKIKEIKGLDNLVNINDIYLRLNEITEIKGLENLINLRRLDLSANMITEINNLNHLTKLESLLLNSNKISEIRGLDCLVELTELYLIENKINEIKGLNNQNKLKYLHLGLNRIEQMKGMDALINLQKLSLISNKINEIKGLDKLALLQDIELSSNKITEIKGLSHLVNLIELRLDSNRITEIKGLEGLNRLFDINLDDNRITKIKGINNLPVLYDLCLAQNEIKFVPLSIMNNRSLNFLRVDCPLDPIIERFLTKNQTDAGKTFFDDAQNVHDSNIVKTIKDSIYSIMSEQQNKLSRRKVLKSILNDDILTNITKAQLVEYSQDKTVHSILNLTFDEVLCSLWTIIINHKDSEEIKNILNEEMKDSMCKCFTGRLSRLVNSLNGFDDRVSIKISDKQQILNVIIKNKNTYGDLEKQKQESMKELLHLGYDEKTINEYLIYLE